MNRHTVCIISTMVLGGLISPAWGLSLPMDRPGDTRPDLEKEVPKPKEPPQLTLPPIKELPQIPKAPGQLQITLSGFEFEGNTVYSDEELAALLTEFKDRTLTTADLESIRLTITNYYIDNGYINSGALIPDQDLEKNILKLKIIEGHLTNINLSNDGRLRDSYLTGRISPKPEQPLNIGALQERLYMLQQNPRVQRINAALGPGAKRGEGVLDIKVTEDKPYYLALEFNNYRPVSVGEKQGEIHFNHLNLTGAGDSIDLIYDATQGLNAGDLLYVYPVLPNDATIKVEFNYTDSEVIQDEFKDLNIGTKSWSASMGFAYPLLRSRFGSVFLGAEVDRRYSESFLDTSPLSCGYVGGKCNVTALRLSETALWHNATEVVSFRQILSFGVDAFNASMYKGEKIPAGQPEDRYTADGRFTTWLLQFQWAKRYMPVKLQSVLRADLQLAFDPLLSMEQYAVGGAYTVRGYRENQYVSDNGFIASLEFRYPIYHTPKQELQTMVFYDHGQSWDYNQNIDQHSLASVGLGLRYTFSQWVNAQVYWGHQLKDIDYDGEAWQNNGFHVALRVNAL